MPDLPGSPTMPTGVGIPATPPTTPLPTGTPGDVSGSLNPVPPAGQLAMADAQIELVRKMTEQALMQYGSESEKGAACLDILKKINTVWGGGSKGEEISPFEAMMLAQMAGGPGMGQPGAGPGGGIPPAGGTPPMPPGPGPRV